eukprot:7596444-Alexandrium_andersonii.AAC.1
MPVSSALRLAPVPSTTTSARGIRNPAVRSASVRPDPALAVPSPRMPPVPAFSLRWAGLRRRPPPRRSAQGGGPSEGACNGASGPPAGSPLPPLLGER